MKRYLSALALSAAIAMPVFTACNSDVDDLKTRVTVLEGMIRSLEADLQAAMVTGSTILSSSQASDGTWTLNLSDGKAIVISPAAQSQAGGSSVTVTETAEAFVIKVDANEYAIPKASSAAVNSIVFVPEYEDGALLIGNDDAVAKFLVTPALTDAQVQAAQIEIADAREVQTRAGENMFKITSQANEDGLLKLTVKGLAVSRGSNYVAAIKVTVDGTTISSNYFKVAVSDDFSFISEALEAPVLKSDVVLTVLDGDLAGFHRALIPNSAIKFATSFNFKDYFQTLPSGNVTFELAPAAEQNDNVKAHYNALKNFIKPDGSYQATERLGTDCFDANKNGILVYVKANEVVKAKIFWQIDNPIPGLNLPGLKSEFGDAPHMEYGYTESLANDDPGQKYLAPGENRIHFATLFANPDEYLPLRHDGSKFVNAWNADKMKAMVGDEDVFFVDGNDLVLGDYGKAICAFSRGILWQSTQPSIIKSNRRNLPADQKTPELTGGDCNGEIIPGYDGIGADEFRNTFGVYFDETGGDLVTTADYKGNGFRIAIGLRFEYFYGAEVISSGNLCYLFFNRRVCAPGVVDPAGR